MNPQSRRAPRTRETAKEYHTLLDHANPPIASSSHDSYSRTYKSPTDQKPSSGSLPRKAVCAQCNLGVPDPRYGDGICEACYHLDVDRAFGELPKFPEKLQMLEDVGGNAIMICKNCQLRWPLRFCFADSRGHSKCVICRKWELQNKVELDPTIQIHLAVGERNSIRCFHCGRGFDKEEFGVCCSESRVERMSMFCKGCRVVETRYDYQGFLNVEE